MIRRLILQPKPFEGERHQEITKNTKFVIIQSRYNSLRFDIMFVIYRIDGYLFGYRPDGSFTSANIRLCYACKEDAILALASACSQFKSTIGAFKRQAIQYALAFEYIKTNVVRFLDKFQTECGSYKNRMHYDYAKSIKALDSFNQLNRFGMSLSIASFIFRLLSKPYYHSNEF